jgi:nitrite reductase (NADH) small subunit
MKYLVGNIADVPRGGKRSYKIKNIPIVVVHSEKDQFYAIYERCPHQGVSLCAGTLGGETVAAEPGAPFEYAREGEILRCPWHGFSFDVTTGVCVNASEFRVRTYPLSIDQSQLFLEL